MIPGVQYSAAATSSGNATSGYQNLSSWVFATSLKVARKKAWRMRRHAEIPARMKEPCFPENDWFMGEYLESRNGQSMRDLTHVI